MLMATARRYTMEQIEAARKKLRSLPVKEAGKTRGEVAEFLVNDIKKAMRRGYTLRDIRDLLADAGVSVPLARLEGLFGKTPKPETVADGGGAQTDTGRPDGAGEEEQYGRDMRRKRNGAAKAYALAAPCFGRGADGLFISAPCFLAFLLCVLPGKLPHKSGDVGSSPCAGTRPQFYRLGETSVFAPLPPCAFAHGDDCQNLRQTQESCFVQH